MAARERNREEHHPGVAERLRPGVRTTLCVLATAGVLAAISPPRLPADDAGGTGAAAPPAAHGTLPSRTFLGGVPAADPARVGRAFLSGTAGQAPARRGRFGFALGRFRIGPDGTRPAFPECGAAADAPALGRTYGPLACAQPLRSAIVRW